MSGGATSGAPSRPRVEIELSDLADMLAQEVDALVRDLLPGGQARGRHYYASGFHGGPGTSLVVDLSGGMRGRWTEFAASKGSKGRAGDMLSLVAEVNFGGDLKRAIQWARAHLGVDDRDPDSIAKARARRVARKAKDDEARAQRQAWLRGQAERIFLSAGSGDASPVAAYLAGRGIVLPRWPRALRFDPACKCGELAAGAHVPARAWPGVPAMVARVQWPDGKFAAVHRTWLGVPEDWADGEVVTKAALAQPKMVLGDYQGAHIPLWKGAAGDMKLSDVPQGTELTVSEGIEDGLSCAVLDPARRVVAGVSVGAMFSLALPPPQQMGTIWFAVQNDAPGSAAAKATEDGLQAMRARGYAVAALTPPEDFKDWNDVLTGKRMAVPVVSGGDGT
ncbi:DUF7146 domain-containing protein [Pacificimonas sp. ICDLI1SI03]